MEQRAKKKDYSEMSLCQISRLEIQQKRHA